MQQPPEVPTRKKKSRRWLVVGSLILVIIVGMVLVSNHSTTSSTSSKADQSDTPVASTTTPVSTTVPQWKTIHTFIGVGSKKTVTFAVPGDWRIAWSCTGVAVGNGTLVEGALAAIIYNSDNTLADTGFNTTCKGSNTPTVDSTEEHQAGDVYLNIMATGAWTIQIQALH